MLALALTVGPLLAAPGVPPWVTEPDARIIAESTLVFDRWRGATADPVERVGVRQRLFLQWFAVRPTRPHHVAADVTIDLLVDADLGPTVAEQARLPVDRRPAIEPRRAAVRIARVYRVLDLEIGRHAVVDALGFETYDGLSAELAAPYLALGGSAGLAVTPGFSDFGPDIFEPDGTGYDDALAWAFAARAEARGVPWLDAGLALRQRRSSSDVQRSEAGYSARLHAAGLSLSASGRADLVYARFADLTASAAWRGPIGASLAWRRRWPTFRADSIWNAFSAEPYHAGALTLDGALGDWSLALDGEARFFDAGDRASQQPGVTAPTAAPAVEDERSYEGGARLAWAYGAPDRRGELGVEGRVAEGYGGARRYGDVFARTPLPLWRPMDLRARLGAVSVVARRDEAAQVSGWGLLGVDWPIAATIRLEAIAEVYVADDPPVRIRALTNVRFEDWW